MPFKVKLKYGPKTCTTCGGDVITGQWCEMERLTDPADYIQHGSEYIVVSCTACNDSIDRQVVDMRDQKRATTLARAIENRKAREKRKREREERRSRKNG